MHVDDTALTGKTGEVENLWQGGATILYPQSHNLPATLTASAAKTIYIDFNGITGTEAINLSNVVVGSNVTLVGLLNAGDDLTNVIGLENLSYLQLNGDGLFILPISYLFNSAIKFNAVQDLNANHETATTGQTVKFTGSYTSFTTANADGNLWTTVNDDNSSKMVSINPSGGADVAVIEAKNRIIFAISEVPDVTITSTHFWKSGNAADGGKLHSSLLGASRFELTPANTLHSIKIDGSQTDFATFVTAGGKIWSKSTNAGGEKVVLLNYLNFNSDTAEDGIFTKNPFAFNNGGYKSFTGHGTADSDGKHITLEYTETSEFVGKIGTKENLKVATDITLTLDPNHATDGFEVNNINASDGTITLKASLTSLTDMNIHGAITANGGDLTFSNNGITTFVVTGTTTITESSQVTVSIADAGDATFTGDVSVGQDEAGITAKLILGTTSNKEASMLADLTLTSSNDAMVERLTLTGDLTIDGELTLTKMAKLNANNATKLHVESFTTVQGGEIVVGNEISGANNLRFNGIAQFQSLAKFTSTEANHFAKFGGSLTIASGSEIASPKLYVAGNLSISGTGSTLDVTADLDVNGNLSTANNAIITITSANFDVAGDLTMTNTSQIKNGSNTNNVTITGAANIGAGTTFTGTTQDNTVIFANALTVAGTLTARKLQTSSTDATKIFTVNNGGAVTVTHVLDVDGLLTINAGGAVTASASTMTAASVVKAATISGTFAGPTSDITTTFADALTVAGTLSAKKLQTSSADATKIFTVSGAVTVTHVLDVDGLLTVNGGTVTASANTISAITVAGVATITSNGTFTGPANPDTTTVGPIFAGNLTISAGGDVTAKNLQTLAGALSVTGTGSTLVVTHDLDVDGSLSTADSAIVTITSAEFNVAGTLTMAGGSQILNGSNPEDATITGAATIAGKNTADPVVKTTFTGTTGNKKVIFGNNLTISDKAQVTARKLQTTKTDGTLLVEDDSTLAVTHDLDVNGNLSTTDSAAITITDAEFAVDGTLTMAGSSSITNTGVSNKSKDTIIKKAANIGAGTTFSGPANTAAGAIDHYLVKFEKALTVSGTLNARELQTSTDTTSTFTVNGAVTVTHLLDVDGLLTISENGSVTASANTITAITVAKLADISGTFSGPLAPTTGTVGPVFAMGLIMQDGGSLTTKNLQTSTDGTSKLDIKDGGTIDVRHTLDVDGNLDLDTGGTLTLTGGTVNITVAGTALIYEDLSIPTTVTTLTFGHLTIGAGVGTDTTLTLPLAGAATMTVDGNLLVNTDGILTANKNLSVSDTFQIRSTGEVTATKNITTDRLTLEAGTGTVNFTAVTGFTITGSNDSVIRRTINIATSVTAGITAKLNATKIYGSTGTATVTIKGTVVMDNNKTLTLGDGTDNGILVLNKGNAVGTAIDAANGRLTITATGTVTITDVTSIKLEKLQNAGTLTLSTTLATFEINDTYARTKAGTRTFPTALSTFKVKHMTIGDNAGVAMMHNVGTAFEHLTDGVITVGTGASFFARQTGTTAFQTITSEGNVNFQDIPMVTWDTFTHKTGTVTIQATAIHDTSADPKTIGDNGGVGGTIYILGTHAQLAAGKINLDIDQLDILHIINIDVDVNANREFNGKVRDVADKITFVLVGNTAGKTFTTGGDMHQSKITFPTGANAADFKLIADAAAVNADFDNLGKIVTSSSTQVIQIDNADDLSTSYQFDAAANIDPSSGNPIINLNYPTGSTFTAAATMKFRANGNGTHNLTLAGNAVVNLQSIAANNLKNDMDVNVDIDANGTFKAQAEDFAGQTITNSAGTVELSNVHTDTAKAGDYSNISMPATFVKAVNFTGSLANTTVYEIIIDRKKISFTGTNDSQNDQKDAFATLIAAGVDNVDAARNDANINLTKTGSHIRLEANAALAAISDLTETEAESAASAYLLLSTGTSGAFEFSGTVPASTRLEAAIENGNTMTVTSSGTFGQIKMTTGNLTRTAGSSSGTSLIGADGANAQAFAITEAFTATMNYGAVVFSHNDSSLTLTQSNAGALDLNAKSSFAGDDITVKYIDDLDIATHMTLDDLNNATNKKTKFANQAAGKELTLLAVQADARDINLNDGAVGKALIKKGEDKLNVNLGSVAGSAAIGDDNTPNVLEITGSGVLTSALKPHFRVDFLGSSAQVLDVTTTPVADTAFNNLGTTNSKIKIDHADIAGHKGYISNGEAYYEITGTTGGAAASPDEDFENVGHKAYGDDGTDGAAVTPAAGRRSTVTLKIAASGNTAFTGKLNPNLTVTLVGGTDATATLTVAHGKQGEFEGVHLVVPDDHKFKIDEDNWEADGANDTKIVEATGAGDVEIENWALGDISWIKVSGIVTVGGTLTSNNSTLTDDQLPPAGSSGTVTITLAGTNKSLTITDNGDGTTHDFVNLLGVDAWNNAGGSSNHVNALIQGTCTADFNGANANTNFTGSAKRNLVFKDASIFNGTLMLTANGDNYFYNTTSDSSNVVSMKHTLANISDKTEANRPKLLRLIDNVYKPGGNSYTGNNEGVKLTSNGVANIFADKVILTSINVDHVTLHENGTAATMTMDKDTYLRRDKYDGTPLDHTTGKFSLEIKLDTGYDLTIPRDLVPEIASFRTPALGHLILKKGGNNLPDTSRAREAGYTKFSGAGTCTIQKSLNHGVPKYYLVTLVDAVNNTGGALNHGFTINSDKQEAAANTANVSVNANSTMNIATMRSNLITNINANAHSGHVFAFNDPDNSNKFYIRLEQGDTLSVTKNVDGTGCITLGELTETPSVDVNRNTGFQWTDNGVVNICRDRGAFEAFIRRYGSTKKTTNPLHNDWVGDDYSNHYIITLTDPAAATGNEPYVVNINSDQGAAADATYTINDGVNKTLAEFRTGIVNAINALAHNTHVIAENHPEDANKIIVSLKQGNTLAVTVTNHANQTLLSVDTNVGLGLFDTIKADANEEAIANYDWTKFGLTTGDGLVSKLTNTGQGEIDNSMRFYIVNAMTGVLQFL